MTIEKTLEIHLAEQREQIAKDIEAMQCTCVEKTYECEEENSIYAEVADEVRHGNKKDA